jgi:hypothetical protein
MQDDRSVTSLTWHQLPLPGSVGAIGAFHSLLQVGYFTENRFMLMLRIVLRV